MNRFIHVSSFFRLNVFPSQCLLVTSTVGMVHSKASHAAQQEMWVSSVGKVFGFSPSMSQINAKVRQRPPKCFFIWILIQQSTLPITHCALWLSGPFLLSLGILLSSSFHPGRLASKTRVKLYTYLLWETWLTLIFLRWCANGRGPAEFGHQNYGPIWESAGGIFIQSKIQSKGRLLEKTCRGPEANNPPMPSRELIAEGQ